MTDAALSLPLARVTGVLRSRDLLVEVLGAEDTDVSGVSQDSRALRPGDLFLAWKGVDVDAHDFVADAARAGAAATVVERPVEGVTIPQVVVRDGRLAGALAADAVMASPWRAMRMVGVTGTNGKTTTALLLRHLITELAGPDAPAAALGTLGLVGPDGTVREGTEGLTTPGPVELSSWLRKLADEGVGAVVMEASSHALDQRRLDALGFDVAVFTNLSRDHLDYHPDLTSYRNAKAHLLDLLVEEGVAVVNADETAWRDLRPATVADALPNRILYGLDQDADLRATRLELAPDGSRFTMTYRGVTASVDLPLIGRFNVSNALAAAGAALALDLDPGSIAEALSTAPQVPGRMERVVSRPVPVIIDFAHTPDALEGALSTLRTLVRGRLIVLFGAGGDRDRGKRAPMTRAVARFADLLILTSDNPRTEDPEAILDDLEGGLEEGDLHERIVDRRAAIARALEVARPGDLVVLAGKGHERHQTVGTEKRPFDERVVVREVLGR